MPLYRRRHHRVPVRLFIDQFQGQEQWVGLTFNLGSGGLYLCQRPQPIPGQVGLELDLPGLSESIWTKAEVRSVLSQGGFMGVSMAFTAMANGHRSMLQDWVMMARKQLRTYNERRSTLRRLAA
jgi:hypothetical protein